MYILLILFSAFLTYQLCHLKKQYSKTEKINIALKSFIVSTILNHLALYAYFGNMSLVYLENSVTTLFIIKYLILSIITSYLAAYIITNFSMTIIKEQSTFNKKGLIRSIIFIILIIFILSLLYQFMDTYANVPAEQLAFHLQVPIEGTSTSIILDFLELPIKVILVSLLCICMIIIIETKIFKNKIIYLQLKIKNNTKNLK